MSQRTRWVTVDDSLGGFDYQGDWFLSTNTPTYSSTLTGTNSTGTMTFSFQGSEMNLIGRLVQGDPAPRYSCLVDGISLVQQDSETRLACSWKGTASSTPRTLTLEANAGGGTVSVDAIWFQPHPEAELPEGAEVQVDHDDPAVTLVSGNWEEVVSDGNRALVASEPGSSVQFNFTGTRISWEGWRIAGYTPGNSTGSYSIDGGEPIPFVMQSPDPPSTTMRGRVLFLRDLPTPGNHTLLVRYDGPNTPIVLDHFLVQNGDFLIPGSFSPETSASSASGVSNTATTTQSGGLQETIGTTPPVSGASQGTNVGAIAGGVVAGVFVLALLIFGLFWYRKKKANRPNPPSESPKTQFTGGNMASSQAQLVPASPGITPFNLSHPSPLDSATSPRAFSKPSPPGPQAQYELDIISQYRSGNARSMSPTGTSSSGGGPRGIESIMSGSTGSGKAMDARSGNTAFGSATANLSEEVHQHEDSGVRVARRTSLPPVYTPQ